MGDRENHLDRKPGAKAFLEVAEEDIEDARAAFDGERYASCCYHSEQASEKSIKALLILEGMFEAKHDVSNLLRELNQSDKFDLEEVVSASAFLEDYASIPRYPDPENPEKWNPVRGIERKEAKKALEKAEFVLSEIKTVLEKKYEIEN